MAAAPAHRCRVFASPLPGVWSTVTDSARHYGKHWHDCYGFGLLERGAQRSASGRGVVDAHAGELLTVNPGEVHDGRPLAGSPRRWRMAYLTPQALAALATDAGTTRPLAVEIAQPVIRDDEQLAHALRRLLQTLGDGMAPDSAAPLACEQALVEAVSLLLQRWGQAKPTAGRHVDVPLAPVLERLRAGLLAPPSLAELAQLAGLNRWQLLRRFRQVHGLTPHAWLLQQRTEQARGLIASGIPLADAAAAAGFCDQSHMNRVFARQLGFTPGAWRLATACNRVQDG